MLVEGSGRIHPREIPPLRKPTPSQERRLTSVGMTVLGGAREVVQRDSAVACAGSCTGCTVPWRVREVVGDDAVASAGNCTGQCDV